MLGYVGESEGVGSRLANHSSNDRGKDSKIFWTDTVVLVSKDENLTKSHARYIESCLIRAVGGNPRWKLPNSKRPSDDAGKLPLPDRAAMDEFVDQTTTLVGALGWDLFRTVRGSTAEVATKIVKEHKVAPLQGPRFSYRGDGFDAEMMLDVSGDCVVAKGSRARIRTTPTIPKGTTALRQMLQERGILQQGEDFLLFTSDYSLPSPSAAAAVVTAASANGRILWKLADGPTFALWEAGQDQDQGQASSPE